MNLKDYIRGKRHGEAANRLEREAMDDPFLQDAIDGYDSVEGDHYSAIQKLEQQLTRPRERVNKRVWIAAAAALLLLLIGIPFLLHPPQPTAEPLVATTDTRMEKETVKGRTAEEETVEEKTVKEETEEEQVVEEKSVEEKSKTLEEIVMAQQALRSTMIDTARKRDHLLVSGRVLDETGEPVIGATVSLKNCTSGTVTDMDGMFRLESVEAKEFDATAFETKAFGRRDAKAIEPEKKDTETKAFGEKEFREYFITHYDKSLCQGDSIAFTVTFSTRSDGRPTGIQIQESSCPDLETEIKRLLLGSPPWTNTNRKVTLTVKIP